MKRRDGVRKRGDVWYIRLPSGKSGVRSEEPTTATSRKEAKAYRDKRLVEMRQGLYEPDAAKTRVADLVADLRTDYRINGRNVKEIDQRWMHLAPMFGNDLAVAVTTSRLRAYVQARLAEDARTNVRKPSKTQPATVQRELAMLRRAFQLGLEGRKVHRIPVFPTIEVQNVRKGFFERDEFDRVRAELPDDFSRPFVTLAYMLGFRRGELLKLEWRQVDLDKGTVRLDPGTTKNKEGRVVYLPAEALVTLKAWRDQTTAFERKQGCIVARVFHRDGEPVDFFPYKSWRSACKRAGCPGRRPHDFRRSMARNYVRAGNHESVVMRIGGWKTRSVFDRYNVVAEDDLRRAAERVTFSPNGARMGQMGQVVAIDSPKKDANA